MYPNPSNTAHDSANVQRTNHAARPWHAFAGLIAIAALLGVTAIAGNARLQSAETVHTDSAGAGNGVRIGVYDSRAIAVAYIRSDLSAAKLNDLLRERSEAEKRGDAARVAELNELGESLQIRRHLQGFSAAPVDDILDVVRDRLPEVAKEQNIAIITREADYHDGTVELIDITDALVKLFDPDQQTLKMIRELRQREPEAIERIAKLPAVK